MGIEKVREHCHPEKVAKQIEDVAKADGFSFVFDKPGEVLLLYADAKYDVTYKVLDQLKRGSQGGKCETDPNRDCAWALIYDRLSKQGHLDQIIRVAPPKDFRAQDFPARQVNEDYLKGEMEEVHTE